MEHEDHEQAAPAGAEARSIGERLSQLVEAEAEAAETDDDDLDDEDEEESEEAERQRLIAGLQAQIAGLLGYDEHSPVIPCPTCRMGVLGAELQPDPTALTCRVCHGLGMVVTGSRVEGNAVRPCGRCAGLGFETAIPPAPEIPVPAPASLHEQAPLTPAGPAPIPPVPPAPVGVAA